MVKVVIDTSKAEQQGFAKYEGPMPPVGLYKARLAQAWWGMSKGSNGKEPKPMLTIILELKAKNPDKQKYDGYQIWNRITHQESTLWRMQQLFAALGQPQKASINITDKDGSFGKVVSHIGHAQVGKAELLVKAKIEYYEGAERLGVDTLSPVPGNEYNEDDETRYEEDEPETSFEESQAMTTGWVAEPISGMDPTDEQWMPPEDDVPF